MSTLIDQLDSMPVLYRECRCGHTQSDHEPECTYGWGNEPDEKTPCSCVAFDHVWDVLPHGFAVSAKRRQERATCPDPEHPDGAFCSGTTGLAACYPPETTR